MVFVVRAIVVAVCLAVMAAMPAIADEVREEAVRVAPGAGSATLTGHVQGYDSVEYTLDARAGQRMRVSFRPSNTSAYFNIFAPGRGPGEEALFIGATNGNDFSNALPADGTYTVQVYLYRNAARRGERADYDLEITIEAD